MNVLFVKIYAAGTEVGFDDTKQCLITACGITSIAIWKATLMQNAKVFAAALVKIWLMFGSSHTIVVDKHLSFYT